MEGITNERREAIRFHSSQVLRIRTRLVKEYITLGGTGMRAVARERTQARS